jgi:hypothetical protein
MILFISTRFTHSLLDPFNTGNTALSLIYTIPSLHYLSPGNGSQHRNYNSLTESHTPTVTHEWSVLITFLNLRRSTNFPWLPSAEKSELRTEMKVSWTQVLQWLSQSRSYVMTDRQSASLSWCQGPIWDLRRDFYYCQTVAGSLTWGALSDERTGLSFTIAAGPRQCSHFWIRVQMNSWPYLAVSDSRLPQPARPGPRIYISQGHDGPVISPCTGFLYVASYDSQGYGGGIRTRLHASNIRMWHYCACAEVFTEP